MIFLFADLEKDSHAGCEDTAGPGVVWSYCDKAGADLTGADLTGAVLNNANLNNANLTGANLTGADLSNANLTSVAGLSSLHLSSAGNIMGINLSSLALTDFDLNGRDLTNANLSFGSLSNADLSNANLTNANLSYAGLSNADLSSANLTNANLSYAGLSNADLSSAILTNVTGIAVQPGSIGSNITDIDPSGPDVGGSGQSNANPANASFVASGIILLPPPAEGETPINEPQATAEENQAEDDRAKQTGSSLSEPEIAAERTESASPPVPESRRKVLSFKSVLERFREFRGKPSAQAYLSLFEQHEVIGFSQEPPVVLADGVKKVRATVISVPGDRNASDVVLMGGRLISMRRNTEFTNSWIVEMEPAKDGYTVSMTVPQDRYMMVYPLTVAPPVNVDLNGSGTVTEDDFALFLRDRGTQKRPRFDLNRDGKRDALDDYIFTANYLVIRSAAKGPNGNKPS